MDYMIVINVILTGILTTLTSAAIAVIRKSMNEYKCVKSSQRLLIKDRIVEAHDYFCGKGNIGKYSRSILDELYEQYCSMGGNGFVESLMDDIRELPIK